MVHMEGSCGHIYLKLRKRPYLGPGTKNEENKPTFFSQTSKVGEKKVGLFYSFLVPGPRYGRFLIFPTFQSLSLFFEHPVQILHPRANLPFQPKHSNVFHLNFGLIFQSIYRLCRACLVKMAIRCQSFRAKVSKKWPSFW